MDIREHMQKNRNLEMKYAATFLGIFQKRLHDYMNYVTGFDIVKFDKDIKTPDGTSTAQWVEDNYGSEAVKFIWKLIL